MAGLTELQLHRPIGVAHSGMDLEAVAAVHRDLNGGTRSILAELRVDPAPRLNAFGQWRIKCLHTREALIMSTNRPDKKDHQPVSVDSAPANRLLQVRSTGQQPGEEGGETTKNMTEET